MFPRRLIAGAIALALSGSACSGSDTEEADVETTQPTTTASSSDATEPVAADDDASTFFPDVLDATATRADDGTWTFAVTLSSPYDTPEQYADAWRVVGPGGEELGFRLLTHDHANEQPFTRSQSGIDIPDGITTVTIEGRDQANGWGGMFLEIELPS